MKLNGAEQVPITARSIRRVHESPGHIVYGVWINHAKSGNLTLRVTEVMAFEDMMLKAGFVINDLS